MNKDKFLTLHALAIKKFAGAAAVADLIGATESELVGNLQAIVAEGAAITARGAFMLTPAGHQTLQAEYPAQFAQLRTDAGLMRGYDEFESVNRQFKQLVTDWQTVPVAGEVIANDHSDPHYDARIIDRLGELHERAAPVLARFAQPVPRLQRYLERLETALDKVENGETQFVSGAKIDSYHTVWFELHEDLLRILARERDE